MKVSTMFQKELSILTLLSILLTLCPFSLTEGNAAGTEETLIAKNSVWKYEDSDTDLYTAKFYEESYVDSAWKTGKAPLGYPATDSNTTFGVLSGGTIVNNREKPNAIITYYFRNNFTVSELSKISELKATVGIDDGFVMYLNGTEVNRTNLDAGTVTHSSAANLINEPSDPSGTVSLDLTSSISLLKEGANQIAVSVHNRDANSSDIYFDMSLTAVKTDGTSNPPEESEPPQASSAPEATADPNLLPGQVNVHMGDDPSTAVNFTYTTLAQADTQVVLNKLGDSEKITVNGTNSIGGANKYYHAIPVTGLVPNTTYEYTVGIGLNIFNGKFKTAPAEGCRDSFKFAYLADTQVANATDAKALGATLEEVSKINDLSFVYLAGDVTDTATSETQWEMLFKNGGSFPNGGQNLFGNNLVSVIQGNHDNNTMNRHINAPAEEGNIVYSYDYGPATFVMLNLETAKSDATAREQQKQFLTAKVAEAKARGQWVLAGFHKSLYTGASHITDSDIIDARKYWCPVLAQLDVDVVMQGHDHVYTRGFVKEDGSRAFTDVVASGSTVQGPDNAPLYMVGGHAGGLKWYSKKNYTVASGDPLLPGYSFLDKNSTDDQSDSKKEQVIVEMNISENEFTLNTYMFKYNTDTDTITTPKYLYDSLTVTRSPNAVLAAGEATAFKGSKVNIPLTLEHADQVGRLKATAEYDPSLLTLDEVNFSGFQAQAYNTDTPGKIVFDAVNPTGVTAVEKTTVATLSFTVNSSVSAALQTTINLSGIEANSSEVIEGQSPVPIVVLAQNGIINLLPALSGDLSGNDKVNGEDALMLLQYLSQLRQLTEIQLQVANFNGDGTTDTADALSILTYSVGK